MYRGSDSVFRFSLIGMAFIFIFFLLIIFSGMYSNTALKHKDAPALIDKTQADAEVAALKQKLKGLEHFQTILAQAGQSSTLNGASLEALLSALELRAQVEQKITASAGSSAQTQPPLSDNEIVSRTLSAIEFRQQIGALLEKELGGQAVAPGQEATWLQWLVDAQRLKSARTSSASAPRNQVFPGLETETFNSNSSNSNSNNSNNSNTIPPCWRDERGDVQFLLSIELRPGNVIVASAWPETRAAEARAIPGVDKLIARGTVSYEKFDSAAEAIARRSGNQCHYSLRVKDNMRSGMHSERIHQRLEALFHLVDLPR